MARIFPILLEPYRDHQLTVTKYQRTAKGLSVEIRHDISYTPLLRYRWCQTITENGSVFKACGKRAYVDPYDPNFGPGGGVCGADDNMPFYWTDAEELAHPWVFSDGPSEPAPASGRSWIQFMTSLNEVTGNTVNLLVAVAWGFDRMANGEVRAAVMRRASVQEQVSHARSLMQMYPAYRYT